MLCDKFPGPVHRFRFEVVADREIAQHLKEGQVLVVSDLFHVGGPEALLHRGEALGWRRGLAHEVGLERGTIPALVKSNVGSPAGIKEALGTTV